MEETINPLKVTSEDVENVKGILFEHLGLSDALLLGIKNKKFFKPSPIQEEAIPVILKNKSLLARAKNGTGKTASFLIPLIQKVKTSINAIQCIIIVPTRELAIQTCDVCAQLAQYIIIKIRAIYGGSLIDDDLNALNKGVHILISTPGRIVDYCNRKLINLSYVFALVIDEADVIINFDQSGVGDQIIPYLPEKCQLILFSATFPRHIAEFKDKFMKDAIVINTMKEFTQKGVSQFFAFVEESQKLNCLYTLLGKLTINQCIIFCNSVNRVNLLTNKLSELKFSCKCIHSKMSQKERTTVFGEFRSTAFRFLVCTDIFNRGIDILALNVVINFDIPSKSVTYLHRIGRSGRFGKIGLGISFVSSHCKDDFIRIKKELSADIKPIPKDANIDKRLYVSTVASSIQSTI